MEDDDELRVNGSLAIPVHELEWRFTASGGPGGQHANRSNTKAEVRFDVLASATLGPHQRARLLSSLGPLVRVVADDERSQARNRALARERLAARLAAALRIQRPRRPTKPTRGAKERRLDDKRRRGSTKQQRSWRPDD
ncbi:MAG: alternative ribosome rescue aminoacyl-tRNA hydrolase ArfB [Acidimicrobiales bacterium]